jgi:hypothetical protein
MLLGAPVAFPIGRLQHQAPNRCQGIVTLAGFATKLRQFRSVVL